jgi:2-amino-4-hydroxy-6-hydroxymethyldihydropteridine diphosphokinase
MQEKPPIFDPNASIAFIGVGSNIDPERHIPLALSKLMESMRVDITSNFYLTHAIERADQLPYYNGMWRVRTDRHPREIKFSVLREIEAALGRRRTDDRHAPRPIDLDLILYSDWVIDEPDLRIPDPDIYRRTFVAYPLREIAPDLILPDSGTRLASLPIAMDLNGLVPLQQFSDQIKRQLKDEHRTSSAIG